MVALFSYHQAHPYYRPPIFFFSISLGVTLLGLEIIASKFKKKSIVVVGGYKVSYRFKYIWNRTMSWVMKQMEGISDLISEETVKDYKDIYRKKTKIKWAIGNEKRRIF